MPLEEAQVWEQSGKRVLGRGMHERGAELDGREVEATENFTMHLDCSSLPVFLLTLYHKGGVWCSPVN